jgi:hypothetical protein
MKDKILHIATIVLGLIAFELVIIVFTSLYWKHQAIIHHSAFFEASSWGDVSFHWNDDSTPQTPFQDGGWEKIQNALFQKKLDTLNVK